MPSCVELQGPSIFYSSSLSLSIPSRRSSHRSNFMVFYFNNSKHGNLTQAYLNVFDDTG